MSDNWKKSARKAVQKTKKAIGIRFEHPFETKNMIIKNSSHRNLNTVFDEIFNSFPSTWGTDNRNESTIPPVNIIESKEAYQIELVAPGRNKEDLVVSIEKGILTVSYEHKAETGKEQFKTIRNEFKSRSFKRSFSIDEKINTEAIEARYENGILYLTLPKKEEIKNAPKQVQVQ